MSEKYTIEDIRDSPPFTWTLLENKVMIGSFDTEGIAELVCKLLNENEARNSKPMITSQIKCELIIWIQDKIWHKNYIISSDNDINTKKEYEEAIEIISNLPCEEN